jgi:3-hydroxyisobutyrate dehydrogenase-like beta-hydroxyacid dehydrogenase
MPESVGFVGLGAMGSRMARRLLDRGYSVVAWNRTPANARHLVEIGLELVASPREVAERTATVLGCLQNDEAISRVYRAPDGLLAGARSGHLFVEHGTFSSALAVSLEAEAARLGALFVDAPVTGGPEGASEGTLVAMAGGGRDELAARENLFRSYLASITTVGPAGAGVRLKLVNQLLVSIHIVAAAEAAALLARSGISLADALPVLSSGWGASAMLDRELPRALRQEFGASGATIEGLIPVQGLVAAALDEVGLRSRLLPMVRELFQEAAAGGFGDADPAALVALYGDGAS